MNKLAFFALLPLVAACGNVKGVWMLTVPYQEDGQTCESLLTENFVDGYVPGDDTPTDNSDWTSTETYVGPDSLLFVQIETTGDGGAVLLLGSSAYPGVKAKDTWTFSWDDSFSDVVETVHTSGYSYTVTSSQVNTGSLSLTMDGLFQSAGTAAGAFALDTEAVTSYVESDTWSDTVVDSIGETGQMPAASFLVFLDDQDNERPQHNDFDVEDCTGDCSIVATDTCSGSNDFAAVVTSYDDEDAYAYLQNSGNGN